VLTVADAPSINNGAEGTGGGASILRSKPVMTMAVELGDSQYPTVGSATARTFLKTGLAHLRTHDWKKKDKFFLDGGGVTEADAVIALCTVRVFDRNLHSRMPLVPTPARLKRAGV
jgi:hypothetical protein